MNHPIRAAFSYALLLILLIAMHGRATRTAAYPVGTLTVLTTNDSGAGSLRQTIVDATAGDTIIFHPSLSGATIRLQQTLTDHLIINKNLTIDGSALASKITISGDSDNDGQANVRVFSIEAGATATLNSLIITKGGNGSIGGGIVNAGTLTLINCTVSESYSEDRGGGIYTSGTLTLSNSTISHNRSNGANGGGIAAFGTVNITDNSAISDNWALYGGGIWTGLADGITIIISNSTVSANSAIFQGGGIHIEVGSLVVSSSTVSNNTAGAQDGGGGIYGHVTLINSTLSGNTTPYGKGAGLYSLSGSAITDSTIAGNIAAYDGGGIYVKETTGSATIVGSTLSGNQAGPSFYGGAIMNRSGAMTSLTNSTVSGNAGGYSGGIENQANATLNLTSVTIADNTQLTAGDGAGGVVTRGTLNIGNTIIANSVGADCLETETSTVNPTSTNIVEDGHCRSAAIAEIMLGPLANNGGPTQTHALLAGSPAIDHRGYNEYCDTNPGTSTRDQRGFFRPVDGDAVAGAVCDIGAYEFGSVPRDNHMYLPLLQR
jgi:predicted outer membrane repeat protein